MIFKKIEKFLWFYMVVSFFMIQPSPVSVTCGGTEVSSATAYAVLCGGDTPEGALQFIASLGTAGQFLTSNGASVLSDWNNKFPGYTAGTGFIYAGSTTTLAASPTGTMIFSTTPPVSITNSATDNIAIGYNALNAVELNVRCVALGSQALAACTGSDNIGIGYQAGTAITSGTDNIAIGVNALATNQTGNYNIAIGNGALQNNTVSGNVGIGYQAMQANTSGTGNVGIGYQALLSNLSGSNNSVCGYQALSSNVSGIDNVAVGYQALLNATGSQNVAVGSGAGSSATTGSNNIYIGYNATPIAVNESNNIIIGNSSNNNAYLFGITGQTSTSGVNWQISASSQLGIATSSKRFKCNIEPVEKSIVDKMLNLEVVQFHYKNDETEELQYGMIAEDVESIFPETIVYDTKGQIFTIQYHKYVPLLIEYVQQDDLFALEQDVKNIDILLHNLKNVEQYG